MLLEATGWRIPVRRWRAWVARRAGARRRPTRLRSARAARPLLSQEAGRSSTAAGFAADPPLPHAGVRRARARPAVRLVVEAWDAP